MKKMVEMATEQQEQEAVIQWARLRTGARPELGLLNSSLNGVRLETNYQRQKAHRGGMQAGYPDLFLPVNRRGFYGLFIEMKKKGGVPSDVSAMQHQWLSALIREGYFAAVAFGADDAIFLLDWYLAGRRG